MSVGHREVGRDKLRPIVDHGPELRHRGSPFPTGNVDRSFREMGLIVLGARLQHFVRVFHRLGDFLPVQVDRGKGILGLDDIGVRSVF